MEGTLNNLQHICSFQFIATIDSNKDGKVSKDEIPLLSEEVPFKSFSATLITCTLKNKRNIH